MRFAIALAMGVSVCLPAWSQAAESAAPTASSASDPSADLSTPESSELQLTGTFPPLAPIENNQQVTTISRLEPPPSQLSNSPMAPLPPAIVAGPFAFAIASWIAHRANRRGGKI